MNTLLSPARLARILSLTALLGSPTALRANTEKDVLIGGSALDSAGSYSGGTLPGIASDLTFTNNNYAFTTFTLNASGLNVGTLDDLDATQALTISSSKTLTLFGGTNSVAGSASNDLFYLASGANLTYGGTGTLMLGVNGNFDTAGTAQATINTVVAGGAFLGKTGAGTLTLTGTNTYSGGTTFAGGVLNAGSAGALGSTGTLTFTGGTLQYSAANVTDYSARFSTAANQAFSIDTNGQSVSYASALTSSGGTLTKLGNGTLTLGGANTYTGNTTVRGGTLAVTGSVQSGINSVLTVDGSGTSPTLNLSGTGILSTGVVYLGYDYAGTINQTGGTFNTNGNNVYLGNALFSNGTYNLSGGSLSTGDVYVGNTGGILCTFTQSGGTFDTNQNHLRLGYNAGVSGTYNLSGTGSLTTAFLEVGFGGTGTFAQSGGTVTANLGTLTLGYSAGSSGTYNMSGGSLSASMIIIGENGSGTVNQSGGTVIGDSTEIVLQLGFGEGQGTYNLNGGTLAEHGIESLGVSSTFNFNGGTLQALGVTSSFLKDLTTVNVQAGGAIVDTQGYSVTMGQTLLHDTTSGAPATDGGLTKLGTGTLILNVANTFTGATRVNAGTLLATNGSGSATGTGAVMVNNGGTLGGKGTITGAVTVQSGGTLAPGALAVSRLTLGSTLALQGGSTLAITISGTTAGSGYDEIQVGGRLTLGGALNVRAVNGFTLAPGETFTILDDTSGTLTTGTFSNALATLYTDAAGDTFLVNYAANVDGGTVPNDVTLTVLTVVPEPSTWALVVLGGASLLGLTLRKSRLRAV